jgi:hypothetical protein
MRSNVHKHVRTQRPKISQQKLYKKLKIYTKITKHAIKQDFYNKNEQNIYTNTKQNIYTNKIKYSQTPNKKKIKKNIYTNKIKYSQTPNKKNKIFTQTPPNLKRHIVHNVTELI